MQKKHVYAVIVLLVVVIAGVSYYFGVVKPSQHALPTTTPTPMPTLAPSVSPTPAPTVSPTTSPTPTPTMSPTSGQFVGSKNSNIYHYPSCPSAKNIKPENEIWFTNSTDARNHGYIPCEKCNPA